MSVCCSSPPRRVVSRLPLLRL
ncbi:hypothetical protein FisN_4Lh092, partial [Fistulifera solaris]